jgi:peptide-methionine (S)-S-oxide reductase
MEKTATLGNGCFWCTEAVFMRLIGVSKVVSGYSGGHMENPDYKSVCSGTTGHAECLQITFDDTQISYEEILSVFWGTHDPTTLNRQGEDVGTQYRSVIFYHNEEQKTIAEEYIKQLTAACTFKNPIVTTLEPISIFYPAEDYHQNYLALNGSNPYCQLVVKPKVEKFEKKFSEKIKNKNS